MYERLLIVLGDICPGVDFEKQTALIDDGILESLDIVMLIPALMDEFDIELTVDDLVPENFNSLSAIYDLILEKQK